MRTTLSIDDGLLERAKKRAADQGVSLGRFVDQALREHLTTPSAKGVPVSLTVVEGGRPLPGISLTSNRALYDALDDADDEPR